MHDPIGNYSRVSVTRPFGPSKFTKETTLTLEVKSQSMTSLKAFEQILAELSYGLLTNTWTTYNNVECTTIPEEVKIYLTMPSTPNCWTHSQRSLIRTYSSDVLSGHDSPHIRRSCASSEPSGNIAPLLPSKNIMWRGRVVVSV